MTKNALNDIKKNIGQQLHWLELAGWLHNLSKCSTEFVLKPNGEFRPWVTPANAYVKDRALIDAIGNVPPLTILGGSVTLKDLVEKHLERLVKVKGGLNSLMAQCHENASGSDKRSQQKEAAETAGEDFDRDPNHRAHPGAFPWTSITPFGYAQKCVAENKDRMDQNLEAICLEATAQIVNIRSGLATSFRPLQTRMRECLADAEYPLQDIRVSDMGLMVAALLKTAALGFWLKNDLPFHPVSVQWQLIHIAADIPAFAESAVRMTDINARRAFAENTFDLLRDSLETMSMVACEVARGDFGAFYLAPPSKAILDEFRQRAKGHEIPLTVHHSEPFGVGRKKGYSHQLGKLMQEASAAPATHEGPPVELIHREWAGVSAREVCPACLIRPIAETGAASDRKLCETCLQRREGRVKNWLDNPAGTIWVNEVEDTNGRIAVVAARIPVEDWLLDGGPLERTCFLQRYEGGAPRNIPPSSARARRILETIREFWLDCEQNFFAIHAPRPSRCFVTVNKESGYLARLNTYELIRLDGQGVEESGIRVSAVWTGDSFIPTVNPFAKAGTQTIDAFFSNGKVFRVRTPAGYGTEDRDKIVATVKVAKGTDRTGPSWQPYMRLRLDAREFRCLVPADRAMAFAGLIESMFVEQMGRVRNRLPIHISIIAGQGATPLRAFLDAAQRAQARKSPNQEIVRTITQAITRSAPEVPVGQAILPAAAFPGGAPPPPPIAVSSPVSVELAFDDGLTASIPVRFEAPSEWSGKFWPKETPRDTRHATPDDYFPYFELPTGDPENPRRVVHATNLIPGDQVYWTPSTFDFEYLDSASRRFDLAYDPTTGNRRPARTENGGNDRSHRPLPIEAIHELRALGRLLTTRLATGQIKTLDGLLAAKLEEWKPKPPEPAFIEAMLSNLEFLPAIEPFFPSERALLVKAACSGRLQDAIEIVIGIEKGGDK